MTIAAAILDDFAQRTGLVGGTPPRRYLWTDAFAVCACLSLHRRHASRGEPERAESWLGQAVRLVEQVHRVLGRHRPDDLRTGWISALGEEEGARHPTAGGLRIGKPLPERRPDEPRHPGREWDRDGQYYHYLTRWMHALARAASVTGESRYHRWAVELARTAHRAFVGGRESEPRTIRWKMSVDLSRPLVPMAGHLDPLDGLLTLRSLRATDLAGTGGGEARADHAEELNAAIGDLATMCAGRNWTTDDALDIGCLLVHAHTARLLEGAPMAGEDAEPGSLPASVTSEALLRDAAHSLDAWDRSHPLERPDSHRVPYRELGLAIGLAAVGESNGGLPRAIARRRHLIDRIRDHWIHPVHRTGPAWTEQEDINAVMLATLEVPEDYLAL